MKIVICDDVQSSIDTIRTYIHKLCADLSIAYDTEIFYDGRDGGTLATTYRFLFCRCANGNDGWNQRLQKRCLYDVIYTTLSQSDDLNLVLRRWYEHSITEGTPCIECAFCYC